MDASVIRDIFGIAGVVVVGMVVFYLVELWLWWKERKDGGK